MAAGLNHYLKNYCHTHVSWYASETVEMPDVLPEIPQPVYIRSKCDNRFLNYCTFGYTMPYWKWQDWERLIDWMALNVSHHASCYYRTRIHLVQSMDRHGFERRTGSLILYRASPSSLASDVQCRLLAKSTTSILAKGSGGITKRILEREREFDMTPVLPAFAGHVPAELKQFIRMQKSIR